MREGQLNDIEWVNQLLLDKWNSDVIEEGFDTQVAAVIQQIPLN